MSDDTIYTLVPLTSRGRYALDDPLHGQDLTSGQSLALLLGGCWIDGSIEHASGLYTNEHTLQAVSSGYYFLASDGNVCGLCEGRESPRKVTGGDRRTDQVKQRCMPTVSAVGRCRANPGWCIAQA